MVPEFLFRISPGAFADFLTIFPAFFEGCSRLLLVVVPRISCSDHLEIQVLLLEIVPVLLQVELIPRSLPRIVSRSHKHPVVISLTTAPGVLTGIIPEVFLVILSQRRMPRTVKFL